MLSSISWNLSKLVYYFKGRWSRSAASEGPYLLYIRYDFVNPKTLNSRHFLQSSGSVPGKEELFWSSVLIPGSAAGVASRTYSGECLRGNI